MNRIKHGARIKPDIQRFKCMGYPFSVLTCSLVRPNRRSRFW